MLESVLLFVAKVFTILIYIGYMALPFYLLFTLVRAIWMDIKGCDSKRNKK